MATLQINVPDDIKTRFENAFSGQDIGQVVTRLMREALEQAPSKPTAPSVWDHILRRPYEGTRSREEIDAQIKAERASWGEQ
ncbi:hypothetical protein [Methylomagnum sp.]